MDARSNKGFASKSPFNRERANNIYGDGSIDMSQTRRPLIAMDGQQVRTLQPGQNAQFQGMVTEMDPDFLFALEGPLLEKHLGTLKADQQAEFIEKYEPLPENMKRAALMQMAQLHQDVVQQAMAQEEGTPQLKYGGRADYMQNGGTTKPNYQTLGAIKFDSNTSRQGPDGQMVVRDINSGKDFGVVRNNDGSYKHYAPRKKLQDNVPYTPMSPIIKGMIGESNREYVDQLEPYLTKLAGLSSKRVNGNPGPEETALREELYNKISPFSYEPAGALKGIKDGQEGEKMDRGEYLREYLGLSSNMVPSSYEATQGKTALKPYTEGRNRKNTYSDNDIYETYRNAHGDVGKSGHNISTTAGFKFGPLGTYTLGRGVDDSGEYISVYDKWDLNPLRYNQLDNIPGVPDINKYNNPFEVYDRKYLSELSQAGRDSVYAKDKELGVTPQDKRTKRAMGGLTATVTERGKYQDGGTYQQVQAPTEGFQFTGITSNRPTKENTVDIAKNPQGFRRGTGKTTASGNGKGSSTVPATTMSKQQLLQSIPQEELMMNYQSGLDSGLSDPTIVAEIKRREVSGQPVQAQPTTQQLGFNGYMEPVPYSRSTEVIQTVTGRALPTAYMPTTSVDYTPAYSGPHIYKRPVGLNVPVEVSNESVRAPLQSDLRLPNKMAYDTPFQVTERESDQFQHVSTDPQGRWSTYYDPQFKRYLRREHSGLYKRVDKP